jgi:hypothetical protein
MRWLAWQIKKLLGPVDRRTAAHLALFSGIGEEILFRGAMQPAFGYVATSVLFGLLHVGPDRRYLVWTAFAMVLGFALGGILLLTGSLLGPILAHVLINYLNLLRIGREGLPGTDGTPRAMNHGSGPGPYPRDPRNIEGGEA